MRLPCRRQLPLALTVIKLLLRHAAYFIEQMLEYVTPSDPQTGLRILIHDVGQTQVGWSFIILQFEYGLLEQLNFEHGRFPASAADKQI